MENPFSINAQTYTLKHNNQKNGDILLDGTKQFVIPIYQRPYSWKKKQVEKLCIDIFSAYWEQEEERLIEEPIFIGTMQLSPRSNDDKNIYNVIDGQQRLTTLILLLSVLKSKFPNSKKLKDIQLDWLTTRVNNGIQQNYLEEALNSQEKNTKHNPYLQNKAIITNIVNQQFNDDYDDIEVFIRFLYRKIYFVVIETHAGLSKTLQIFKAINTTGLDLNGGDIFKIRMYEYLRAKKKSDETVFNDISAIYKEIDECNQKMPNKFIGIQHVLDIYKYILVAKYQLPVTLYYLGATTFFERLFDTLLGVEKWDRFKNHSNRIELSLQDLKDIIHYRNLWEEHWHNKENLVGENIYTLNLFWQTFYSRYWLTTIIFMFAYRKEENMWEQMKLFTKKLSKLYTIYTIRNRRLINDVYYKFSQNILKSIMNPSDTSADTIQLIEQHFQNKKGLKNDVRHVLNGNIVYNRRLKNLVCRLSAMLEENYRTNDKTEIDRIGGQLFASRIDIEHIQSVNDKIKEKRPEIWKNWGENLHSIGNLMVLESSLNKSIGNKEYKDKMKVYSSKSKFAIVKNQPTKYAKWELEDCLDRKKKEIDKIITYLFD